MAADTALSGALVSAYQAADTSMSGVLVSSINTKLALSGGIMTGPITLSADPTVSGQAATKQYVDSRITVVSGAYVTLTGNQTVSGLKVFATGIGVGGGYLTGSNLVQVNSAGNIPTTVAGVSSIFEIGRAHV